MIAVKRNDIPASDGVPVMNCEEEVIDYIYDYRHRQVKAGTAYDSGILEIKHRGLWCFGYTIDFDLVGG